MDGVSQGIERSDEIREVPLVGVAAEYRSALQEEIEAARRQSASGALRLHSGQQIAQVGSAYQYRFSIESALQAPDDSPAELRCPVVPKGVEATIVAVEGLAITISVPV